MPEKQVTGRFEENFIEHRRVFLERFLNRIAQHPILRRSRIFHHFLTAAEYKAWKLGKRRAEKENKISPEFYKTVSCDLQPLEQKDEDEISEFKKQIAALDKSLRVLEQTSMELCESKFLEISSSLEKLGNAYKLLSSNDKLGLGWRLNCYPSQKLEDALKEIGVTFTQLSKMWIEKSQQEMKRIVDNYKEYNQIIHSIQETLHVKDNIGAAYHSIHAKQVKMSSQTLTNENDKANYQLKDKVILMKDKIDRITHITLVELEYFHYIRARNMKQYMQDFINIQINFSKKAKELWMKMIPFIEEIPVFHGSTNPNDKK
eukprot:Anaeramoba_ignava/c18802_g1_i2.p1 GENE.c18802_g1_i2~~c18802_g1_i2.p1  ORF type:complete len:317 (-),score=105.04 c18802_g1_i2:65-1015(-)